MNIRPGVALLAITLALSACARSLPVAVGPVRALNAGRWTPGIDDLALPPEKPARPGT